MASPDRARGETGLFFALKNLASFGSLFENWPSVLLHYALGRTFPHFKGSFAAEMRPGPVLALQDNSDIWRVLSIWGRKVYCPPGFEVKRGYSVVDIGAHIGVFTLYAATAAEGVKVLSFEPHPKNYLRLSRNIIASQCDNVVTHNQAVARNSGQRILYPHSFNSGGHSIEPWHFERKLNSLRVDCVTLEEVLSREKINQCDLLKMDCEGAEYEILEGAKKDVLMRVSRITMEYHNSGPNHVERMVALLRQNDFETQISPSQHWEGEGMLYAARRSTHVKSGDTTRSVTRSTLGGGALRTRDTLGVAF